MKKTKNETVVLNPLKNEKCRNQADKTKRASRYNYYNMGNELVTVKDGFAKTLSKLRTEKGISAREMSLSLGQSASYVNDIENGRNLPSMGMFFEICEYLEISPVKFFAYTENFKLDFEYELGIIAEHLSKEDKALILAIAKRMIK